MSDDKITAFNENIRWGSFTKQFKRFIREHPEAKVEDLEDFAKYIAKNPTEFNPTTKKRAAFYTNLILPRKRSDSSSSSSSDSGKEGGAALYPIAYNKELKDAFKGGAFRNLPTNPNPLDHLYSC